MKYLCMALLCSVIAVSSAMAEVKNHPVNYAAGNAQFQGEVVVDSSKSGVLPGIVVFHDWMGISDDTRAKGAELAKLGYVVFLADMYGTGIRPKDAGEAAKMAGALKADIAVMRARAEAALATLRKEPLLKQEIVAATGYCLGGTVALELARSGAPLKGVVSFHGGLATKNPKDASNIKGKVLVLHGAEDPFVTEAEVSSFEEEMRQAHVDWQLNKYSNAVHAFTVKAAGTDPSKGAAYNEEADRRSWQAMKLFLAEIF